MSSAAPQLPSSEAHKITSEPTTKAIEEAHDASPLANVPPKPLTDTETTSNNKAEAVEPSADISKPPARGPVGSPDTLVPILPEPHHGILGSVIDAFKHASSKSDKGISEVPDDREDATHEHHAPASSSEPLTTSDAAAPASPAPPKHIAMPQAHSNSSAPAPSSPDHITKPPAVTPTLAKPAAPSEISVDPPAEPAHHEEEQPPSIPVNAAFRPVERVDTFADLPSHTIAQRSRRNTLSDVDSGRSKSPPMALPGRSAKAQSTSVDHRSGFSTPVSASQLPGYPQMPQPLQHLAIGDTVVLFAGDRSKAFHVQRPNLISKSPYFADLLKDGTTPDMSLVSFPDIDEHGFGLFVRWIAGGQLYGPNDFQTLSHYLSLYCIALRFGVVPLQDETMDHCRAYYRHNNMTAPAYRLEYMYAFTPGPNQMRDFLISTAAYRCLCGDQGLPGPYLTTSMRALIGRGGDLAGDFAEALVKLSRDGLEDARRGADEVWHAGGDQTGAAPEPWQTQ